MKKTFFHILMLTNFHAVGWVAYFLCWYAFDFDNRMRAEYIIGASYVAFYSVPLWAYLSLSSMFRRNKLSKKELATVMSPAIFMVSTLATIAVVAFDSLDH